MLRETVHLVAALQFMFAVYYDFTYVVIPPTVSNIGMAYGGKLKFLTNWDSVSYCQHLCAFTKDVLDVLSLTTF